MTTLYVPALWALVPVDGFAEREYNVAAYTTREAAEAALAVANEDHPDRPRRIVQVTSTGVDVGIAARAVVSYAEGLLDAEAEGDGYKATAAKSLLAAALAEYRRLS